MINQQKIELHDLLEHVREQQMSQGKAGLHLFGVVEGTGKSARCRLVVDDLTDGVRETVAKMQEVAHCAFGLKLEVVIYSLSGRLVYCSDKSTSDPKHINDAC